MKETILLLLIILCHGITYSQRGNIMIASLNGYCGGSITKEEILKSPEIILKADIPDLIISKIAFFSNNRVSYVEYWNNDGQLSQQMLDRIKTLNKGDEIYFNIYVNSGDSITLIHPLELKISLEDINPCSCYNFGTVNIKGITHGKMPKLELIKEGKLTITSNKEEIQLIGYKVTGFFKGEKKVIACRSIEFNSDVMRLIKESLRFQRIYFSDIRISVNGRCFFMNPVEIQLD